MITVEATAIVTLVIDGEEKELFTADCTLKGETTARLAMGAMNVEERLLKQHIRIDWKERSRTEEPTDV